MRREVIGDATLYLGDCLEILPTLPKVDAVITDPPYGIGEAAGKNKSRSLLALSKDYGSDKWDNEPASPEAIALMRAAAPVQVIFGGNYFALPPAKCWLVWDKLNGETDFADCELAWTNLDKAVRRIQYRWHGMLRQNNEPRGDHPTQKPLGVMAWALLQAGSPRRVLDPFMGSGTTGVVCVQAGAAFIGIEREPKYFSIACRRIEQAYAQGKLFEPAMPKQEQASLYAT